MTLLEKTKPASGATVPVANVLGMTEQMPSPGKLTFTLQGKTFTITTLDDAPVRFFGDTTWTPLFEDAHFGIWALVSGTLLTSAIAIAVALPFGLMAAIYLSEIASPRTRKIALRTSMVLGLGRNSVFPVLRRLTRLGLGGRQGSGKQYVSWIHVEDFCRAVEWIIAHDELVGPVNQCAPNPLSNAEMMKNFRQVCRMPIGLPAPEWLLEIGAFFLRTETELIFKSRRVVPGKLLANGFTFGYPHFLPAIEQLAQASRSHHASP